MRMLQRFAAATPAAAAAVTGTTAPAGPAVTSLHGRYI
ncbi:hypothetical protein HDA32_000482 [Spinactinospora alkalitolerans]|uniref:Uncharacterized protein n=1 Tax=Spinactinospora alkalitolerans TaxID=687207 RepID=A0A852TRA2_9ACTN|nr:hypothetical protein [Spinactinospora alkalitolerans]